MMNTKRMGMAVCALALGAPASAILAQAASTANPTPAVAAGGTTTTASDKKLLTVYFRDAALKTVIETISKKTGVSVVVDPRLTSSEITLDLHNQPVHEVLHAVAQAANADLWAKDDIYYLSIRGSAPTPGQPGQSGAQETYQNRIADLLAQGFVAHSQTDKLVARLSEPVDVQLKDATIQQSAEALTHATGIKVTADSSVSRELRLTVEAQHVPLQTVLEGIANQGDLMIGRTGSDIVFRSWPSLNVNGLRTFYRGQLSPWGDEWRTRPNTLQGYVVSSGFGGFPGGGFGFGGGGGQASGLSGAAGGPVFGGGQGFGGTTLAAPGGAGLPQDGTTVFGSGSQAFTGFPGYASMGGAFTMTSLGDRLVIAEPGMGTQGEPGILLTVYQWDNSRQTLRKISSVFHRAQAASRRNSAPGGRGPGQPGMPGGPRTMGGAPEPGGFGPGGGGGFGGSGLAPSTAPAQPGGKPGSAAPPASDPAGAPTSEDPSGPL